MFTGCESFVEAEEVAALDPARYGFNDKSQKFDVNGIVWTSPISVESDVKEEWTLDAISRHLRATYVDRIAYEYMHSPSKTERLWFAHLLESDLSRPPRTHSEKSRIHALLARSETLDQFLQLKFPNLKRYGLEGGESMLPALDALFSSSAQGWLSCSM